MLIESSFCCSIETSPFNVSACESRIAVYDWVSRAETHQMPHKFPEHSQGSFLQAVAITDGQGLVETSNSHCQTGRPEQSITTKKHGGSLTSLVYGRRKRRVKSTEHSSGETKSSGDRLDDTLVYSKRKVKFSGTFTEHDCGTTKRSDGVDCLVYSRRKQRVNSEHNTGKTKGSGDHLCDSLMYKQKLQRVESCGISTENDPGKTKRSDDPLDDYLVYSRKKQNPKCNGTFTENPGKTKKSGDQLDGCPVYSQRKQKVESGGTFIEDSPKKAKNYCDRFSDTIVYSRRKQRVKSAFIEHEPGETKRNNDQLDGFLVYSRKRPRVESSSSFTKHDPEMTKRSGDQLSFGYDAASVAEKSQRCVSRVEPDIKAAVTHSHVCNHENDAPNTALTKELPVAEVACVSDQRFKSCICKTILSMKTGVDEACKCSSSGAVVAENITKNISAKEVCASVLWSNGLLAETWPAKTSAYEEAETGVENNGSSSRLCKICGQSGTAKKMLICDKCDEAFHASCCGIQVKKVPENDEWLCPSCLKTKRKILKETTSKRGGRNGVNPIQLMLRDTRPYTTGVRIGKNFQAEVPDWSGPMTRDTSLAGEPLEIGPSQDMHDSNTNIPKQLSDLGNWLQCRKEGVDGVICGKWRRAPLFELQTDDWECYCCVFWDPAHADCAVPQELETNEILEQLKHIETVQRPKSDAKRRKFERAKSGGGVQDCATSD